MAGDNKTEKATPKRREEARKKGTVAKSSDLNGAVILLVGLITLGITGGSTAQRLAGVMRTILGRTSNSDIVSNGGVGAVLTHAMGQAGLAVAPIIGACAAAAI